MKKKNEDRTPFAGLTTEAFDNLQSRNMALNEQNGIVIPKSEPKKFDPYADLMNVFGEESHRVPAVEKLPASRMHIITPNVPVFKK